MVTALRMVVVDSDPDSRATLRGMLAATPSVQVVGEFAGLAETLRGAPACAPDVLVLEIPYDPGGNSQGGPIGTIELLARAVPDAAIIATGPGVSADLVIEVLRAGAVEYLRRPVEQAHLQVALDKVARLRGGAAPPRRAGRVVSVYATKGGLGVTTVATNLAVCLAEKGPDSALLVDLDTHQSDVATFLNLRPRYSVLDAFEDVRRLDEAFLRGLLVRHPSGLWVLPGPSRMERVQLTAQQIQDGLQVTRSLFDHVVLDLRHDLDPGTIAALEASDLILFLTSLNVSALRSGAAGLAAFRQLGLSLQKVKLVVMREDTGEDVSLSHARETLGVPIHWKTPSDYPAVIASINSGRPVVATAPRSRVARNLRQLAQALSNGAGLGAEPAARDGASLLRRMWSPRRAPGGA